ncbi:MAG: hypothetical protein FD123_398 [Bacteroidetes bacterium]|nr:MAG: hypothetical protein FD123_398 [Bacteroidota bacterium]
MKTNLIFGFLFICGFISCGNTETDKQLTVVQDFFTQWINFKSTGEFLITHFEKTSIHEEHNEGFGSFYVLKWTAKGSPNKNIWLASTSLPDGYIQDIQIVMEEPKEKVKSPTICTFYQKGSVIQFSGECYLQCKEDIWKIMAMKIKDVQ